MPSEEEEPLVLDHETSEEESLGFGESNRAQLEAKLLRKVDARMSILVLIYILNCKFPCILSCICYMNLSTDIDRNAASSVAATSHVRCVKLTPIPALPDCEGSKRI